MHLKLIEAYVVNVFCFIFVISVVRCSVLKEVHGECVQPTRAKTSIKLDVLLILG